jgi:hypothetical protein
MDLRVEALFERGKEAGLTPANIAHVSEGNLK